MKDTTTHKSLATTITLFLLLLTAATAFAQNTAFTHQGRLTDNGAAANGAYDLQFALFDAVSAGTQQGAALTRDDVPVTNGVFTVQLDFGATPFNGAARWLQISVRNGASTGAFTLLNPRQPLNATPYAVRSQAAASADNAAQLGGVAASQYVQTADTRLSDDRTPTAGSANYVQNTTTPQAASNFNISGDGTAGGTLSGNVVNAATQFNLNGTRILSNPGTNNLFTGISAGNSNTTGNGNAFFGRSAGSANTTGSGNAFVGSFAGRDNTTGFGNAFFGSLAGLSNTSGSSNAFFGPQAGNANTNGGNNTFIGTNAGQRNTSGGNNAFVGTSAGFFNTTGGNNAFVGTGAGQANTTGSNNTLLGSGANAGANNLEFATALGAGAVVATGNTLVLGRSNGSDGVQVPGNLTVSRTLAGNIVNSATQFNLNGTRVLSNPGSNNLFAGVDAGNSNTTGQRNAFFGFGAGLSNTTGSNNTALGSGANVAGNFGAGNLSFATAIGANAIASTSNTIVLGRSNGSDLILAPGAIAANGGITATGEIVANGGITSQGAIVANGGIRIQGQDTLTLNGNQIPLRDNSDFNHSISYDPAIDGIQFTAFDRFRWIRAADNFIQMTLRGNGNLELRGALLSGSDARYKTAVQTLPQALDQVLRLRGVSYQWKPEFNRDDRTQIGFIAQEVEAVLPELVSTDDKGFKSVAYANAVPVLVEAIKEQQHRFAAENAALKAQLAALAERLTQLEQQAAPRPR